MYFRPWLNILIRMNRDYHNTWFQRRSRWAIRLYQSYCVLNLKPFIKKNKNKNSTNSRYSIFSKDLGLSITSKKQETWSFYARSIKVGKSAKSNSAFIKNGSLLNYVTIGTIEGNIASGQLTFGTF